MIDLQCCGSLFSRSAGSDPEAPHTQAPSYKHSVKTYASIQTNKHDFSRVRNYASPMLDLTDMQIQTEKEKHTAANQTGAFDPNAHGVQTCFDMM